MPDGAALRLSYSQAAGESNILFEGLPLGNGRLGALTGGSPAREALYLNEITLWSGQKDAVDLAYTAAGMGSYQMLGKLYVDLPGHAQASGYSRSLDISNAVARTQYVAGGHTYRREVFCSHPDKVLVMRLSSDGGSHDGTISLVDGQGASVTGSNGILLAQGKLDGVGERYATHVLAMPDSGTVKYDASKGVLTMSRCLRAHPDHRGTDQLLRHRGRGLSRRDGSRGAGPGGRFRRGPPCPIGTCWSAI
ncbi:glycoside hydrolase N-terminal domain-containing protein [Burkholderia gladioli]|uniref:glycoside hydrolase N-terminal domain-containing protein n=1 Tax=Burkholderia gladioli TaxID=28095 RepID=UPI003D1EBE06